MWCSLCTFPKVIDLPRYILKCSVENVILSVIFLVVTRFPLHFMLNPGNCIPFLTVCSLTDCHGNKSGRFYTLILGSYTGSLCNTVKSVRRRGDRTHKGKDCKKFISASLQFLKYFLGIIQIFLNFCMQFLLTSLYSIIFKMALSACLGLDYVDSDEDPDGLVGWEALEEAQLGIEPQLIANVPRDRQLVDLDGAL